MSLLSRRGLARVGVSAAVAVVAAGAFAAPARADTTADLAIDLHGTTIAADAAGKFGMLSVRNLGPGEAVDLTFTFTIGSLDQTKVEFPLVDECVQVQPGVIECVPQGAPPLPAGSDTDLIIPFTVKPGQTGAAGEVTVQVKHAGADPDTTNNSARADVMINGHGVDLSVFAPDVYALEDGLPTDVPIEPGAESMVFVFVSNQGDETASGIKITIKLPEHVSFTEAEPGDCTHEVGGRETVCEYEEIVLVPAGKEGEGETSDGFFFFPVKVAADTVAPSALTGGVATAEDMAIVIPPSSRGIARALPDNFNAEVPPQFKDVDPSDNVDEFTVFVDKAGGGGNLPITGANTALVAGAGLLVLIVGGVLFAFVRRRRVVLVTPTE